MRSSVRCRNDGHGVSGSSVVNSNSVTSQFASLTRDRDCLRKAIDDTERERNAEEVHMTELTARQAWLTDKIRAAHAALGAKTKQRQMLRGEESRLRNTISQDREALIDVGTQHEKTEQDERDRKSFFLTELDTLNEEMEVALQQYEEKILLNLISVSSVELLVRTKASSSTDSSTQNVHITENGGQRKEYEAPSCSSESVKLVLDSLELLKEANGKLGSEAAVKRDLQQKIGFQRDEALCAMTGEQALTNSDLDELERSWEQEWDNHATNEFTGRFQHHFSDAESDSGGGAASQDSGTKEIATKAISFYDCGDKVGTVENVNLVAALGANRNRFDLEV